MLQYTPSRFPGSKRFTTAGSEPLLQEADPLHSKLDMEYEYWYKMVKKKKNSIDILKLFTLVRRIAQRQKIKQIENHQSHQNGS